MADFKQREWVTWKWGDNWAEGQVTRKYQEVVTRKGSEKNPAYLIKQENGSRVLKLHTELKKA